MPSLDSTMPTFSGKLWKSTGHSSNHLRQGDTEGTQQIKGVQFLQNLMKLHVVMMLLF